LSTGRVLDVEKLSAYVKEQLGKGVHPSTLRLYLASHGIHWEYQFVGSGNRERTRHLKRAGLCVKACGKKVLPPDLVCDDCRLAALNLSRP
jgi:hypothetical protein